VGSGAGFDDKLFMVSAVAGGDYDIAGLKRKAVREFAGLYCLDKLKPDMRIEVFYVIPASSCEGSCYLTTARVLSMKGT